MEGAGLFLIAMAGMLLFGEYLSTGQLLAVALMMFGLLLVTFDQGPDKSEQPAEQGRVEA